MIPAVKRKHNVDDMKNKIRIKLGVIKNNAKKDDLDQARGPTPNVLPNSKPDTNNPKDSCNEFNPDHKIILKSLRPAANPLDQPIPLIHDTFLFSKKKT